MTALTLFIKDPQAVLDYAYDWSGWLGAGETIASHTATPTTGITIDSHTESAGVVTVWLSGGTAGETYSVTCHITTSQGRQDDRSITVRMTDR